MTTGKALNGKPDAGNPHVRFDGGGVALAATPRRGSLLYKSSIISAVVALAAFAKTPAEVPREHRYPDAAQGGHLLVLQCGSDWCESGEDVRKVFESATFRDALGSGWEFAVYDDMDAPTPDVKAANEPLSKLRVESKRFPAITCLTPEPRRFFAQLENIPFDVTAKALAAQVAAATSAKDEAVRLFGMAKASGDAAKAADAYGEAFALLSAQVGEFNGKSLREGGLAFADEWKALVKLDEGDRFGWKLRFEAGTGIDWIEKATKFRTDGDLVGGAAFVADLRAIPTNHLSVVQRQALDIAEYALWRKDVLRKTSNAAHLRHALSLGRDTVWGQCALGYLILSGEKFEKRGRYRAPVRPRPADVVGETPGFPIAKTEARVAAIKPGGGFSEDDKLAIAQYAVLRRIGKDAWDALNARPGAAAFVKEFFGDRAWMEDFAWSGACTDWPKAIIALESIVYQDGGRWIAGDGAGRRFATALALTHHGRDEAWLADLLDAYRSTALAKRLHLSAKSQPVWLWRFALLQTAGCSRPASVEGSFDLGSEAAEQQRFLDAYFNAPFAKYAGACWLVPYRSDNCFGENVHTPFYYESWRAADEWILRRYSPTVGGVCGELSKFGSGCSNAHGLPSAPVSQPSHCAYVRRRLDGPGEIDYSVNRGTGFETVVPEHGHGTFTYCQAHEGTFSGDRERRHDADRLLEAAFFAEKSGRAPEDVAALFASACDAWPTHYCAWRLRGEWIARAARPLEGHRAFADSCAEALKGWRQPLWDILTPYFERVNKERGAAALADELVRMMPALRQGEDKMQEEGFFDSALARWTKPIGKDAALTERVAVAALEAQAGTKDYFAQTLSWCADFMIADAGRFGRLAELLGRLSGGNGQNIDFGRIILAASKAGNFAAFRQMAELQSKVSPLKREGKGYPEKDFGGVLVSADAMLRTSSTSRWDWPASYPLGLDALPLSGNAFHTDKEKEPWAMVVLAGECRVRGVLVANPGGYRGRQPPIEVQLSGDGKEWRTVFSDDAVRTEYRVDLGDKSVVAKFVRVRRVPGAREDFFHLNKILVYGDRMY